MNTTDTLLMLSLTGKIHNGIDYAGEPYNYDVRDVYQQREQKQPGTSLATFHNLEDEVFRGDHVAGPEMDNLLKFRIKINPCCV